MDSSKAGPLSSLAAWLVLRLIAASGKVRKLSCFSLQGLQSIRFQEGYFCVYGWVQGRGCDLKKSGGKRGGLEGVLEILVDWPMGRLLVGVGVTEKRHL